MIEHRLMEEAFDATDLMEESLYLELCRVAKLTADVRAFTSPHHRRALLPRCVRLCQRARRKIRGMRKDVPAILLIGPASTHGGSRNANSTDLIYRLSSRREGLRVRVRF